MLTSCRFGTYSTSEGINAGVDLEMPGPSRWRGAMLTHAVNVSLPYIASGRIFGILR